MDSEQIDAEEEFLKKLYNDYHYQIPKFQRPFSWTEENFVNLIDDLLDAYTVGKEESGKLLNEDGELKGNKNEYEPYFLGSIILNSGGDTGERYDIIDGQQRITSLSILFAVLRDMVKSDPQYSSLSLGELIYEKNNPVKGKSEKVRLKIRDRDSDFFREHVLADGATKDVPLPEEGETEPEQNMLQAINTFRERLNQWESEQGGNLDDFAIYLTLRVVMVRITTGSLSSAFRLFNVTNARGMPLNNADLLKSENLSHIPDGERDQYQRMWEDMEEEVGNEDLERFIGFMRHLLVKEKAQKSIYDEFKENVFPKDQDFRGKPFVEYLQRVFDTHRKRIYKAEIDSVEEGNNVYYHNLVSLMRDFYPSDEWIVALIKFDDKFGGDDNLLSFVKLLERRLTVDWLTGASATDRYTRVYGLLREIKEAEKPEEILELEVLNEKVREKEGAFVEALDLDNFYRKGNYQWPKYILMRLNIERKDNLNKKVEYGGDITIEHVLPQTPRDDYWTERFDDELFRKKWTDRIGNLVTLDGRKNYKASNRAFDEKYETYFKKKSDFPLVDELEKYDEWTPDTLKDRHRELKNEALEIWME
jgi:uncharacterized protein with ParB-like and HNH nuclease domain